MNQRLKKVLPCPFCSEALDLTLAKASGVSVQVRCGKPHCRALGLRGTDEEQAIKRWNKRPLKSVTYYFDQSNRINQTESK